MEQPLNMEVPTLEVVMEALTLVEPGMEQGQEPEQPAMELPVAELE